MGEDWSRYEVDLIISDYMSMLHSELKGEAYNKTLHADALKLKLSNRSRGSIEFKHCNISAAMIEKGLPYIDGYKPRGNYQALVSEVIDEYLHQNKGIEVILENITQQTYSVNEKGTSNGEAGLLELVEDSPTFTNKNVKPRGVSTRSYNYADRENKNKSLGDMGEVFVIQYEQERLRSVGRSDLASSICWVSKDLGDGEGYDIKSYNIDGTERYIEVKTTNFGKCYPFYFTINELLFSEKNHENYYLYRVFNFSRKKRLFILQGALSIICNNSPTHFRGYF